MQPDTILRGADLPESAVTSSSASLEWYERSTLDLLQQALVENRFGKAAVVSSFGAESAVLLHLVSRINLNAPVIFIDTRMMFQETLDYQQELSRHLGLTNIHVWSASTSELRREDVFGRLHLKDNDACCNLRKVRPLEKALSGYGAWVNGRKRVQSSSRSTLQPVETDAAGRIKINPLLHWDNTAIKACFEKHGLPRHPLLKQGFTSIGCAPCTARSTNDTDPRSGRWQGMEKTECGIHVVGGSIVRKSA